jgi:hypothetical protein
VRSTLRLIDPKAFVCVSNDKVDYIITFFIDKLYFLITNGFMNQVLLYSSFFFAFISLFFGLYACGRVAKVLNATKDLDWTAIANMTGDLASTKKTIQTLNNRINGMHSPKIAEQELMMQLLQNQGQKQNGKIVGG